MLKWILLVAAILMVGCIAGEDGKDGRDGQDAKSFVYTGVLYAADTSMNGASVYWDKTIYTLTDSSIVNVWVRQGSGYMWQDPTWYIEPKSHYLRIIDDEKTNPSYEYKVVVSN
jgi:hypothetical protein